MGWVGRNTPYKVERHLCAGSNARGYKDYYLQIVNPTQSIEPRTQPLHHTAATHTHTHTHTHISHVSCS